MNPDHTPKNSTQFNHWLAFILSLILVLGCSANVYSAPVASDMSVSMAQGSVLGPIELFPMWFSVSSPSNVTFKLVKAPSNGALYYRPSGSSTDIPVPLNTAIAPNDADNNWYGSFCGAKWKLTTNPSFVGSDSYQWVVYEGSVSSGTATVSLTITANKAPQASTTRVICDPNSSVTFIPITYDPDSATQPLAYRLVSAPVHGTMSVSGSNFTYTPAANYTGEDSFAYIVNDGYVDSPTCTGRIQVRPANSRAGSVVILLVNDLLYPNLSTEINRLQTDLTNEGYTAKLTRWNLSTSGSTASSVWNYLNSEYVNQSQWLAGAILIGDLPKPKADNYNELVYWNMDRLQTTGAVVNKHIWVARICSQDATYGSETALIKRALDANHAYRTGQSRIPLTAYRYKNPEWWSSTQYLGTVWSTVEQQGGNGKTNLNFISPARTDLGNVVGADCYVKGGDLFEEESHGGPDGYMGMYGGWDFGTNYRQLAQVRAAFIGSCDTGAYGGIANQQLFTRGGANVMDISCTALSNVGETVFSQDSTFCAILGAGESFGTTLLRRYCIGGEHYSSFYGDLSLGAKASQANAIPSVALSASNLTPKVGESVTFTAAVSDADAGQTINPNNPNEFQVEWFLTPSSLTASGTDCYNGGRTSPTSVTTAGHSDYLTNTGWKQTTYTYSSPGTYNVRAEVMDQWMARGWKELVINVQPDYTKPMRFDCGSDTTIVPADGNGWVYDTPFTTGGWGWTNAAGQLITLSGTQSVAGTTNGAVFQTAVSIPSDASHCPTYKATLPNGVYVVNLGFADLWSTGSGQRLVDVKIEGKQVLYGYDAYAAAGPATAVIKSIPVNVTDGVLQIDFSRNIASQADAFINSIEIVPATAGVNYAPVTCAGPDLQVLDSDNNGTQSVVLSAGDTYDADGTIASYQWSENGTVLGSGSSFTANLAVGDHVITLTATDNNGNSSSDQVLVKVVGWGTSDYFTQLFSGNASDLSYKMITFTPNSSPSGYSVAVTPISGFQSPLSLQTYFGNFTRGTYRQWTLGSGHSLKFSGTTYTTFYFTPSGYITFESPDTSTQESIDWHFTSKRIAPLFHDFDVSSSGFISVREYYDRVTVTWYNLTEHTAANSNSFQADLFYDGRIRFGYQEIDTQSGLVGLSQVSSKPADFSPSDYSSYPLKPDAAATYTAVDSGDWKAISWQSTGGGLPVPGSLTNIVFNNSVAISSTNWLTIFNMNKLQFSNQAVALSGEIFVLDGPSPTVTLAKAYSTSIANELVMNQNSSISVASGGTLTVNGMISGPFSLTKVGSGLLTLQPSSPWYNSNSYTGGTTISQGEVYYSANGALGTGNVTVASGAQLTLRAGSIANNLVISGSGKSSGAALYLNGGVDTTCSGTIMLAGNSMISGGNTANMDLNLTGPIQLGAYTLNLYRASGAAAAQNWVASGQISGSGGLIFNFASASGSTSSLTISGSNTYSGVTTVSGSAALKIANVNALQFSTLDTGAVNASKAVKFTVSGANIYNLGGLKGSDDLAIGANTLSIGGNNTDTSYSGILSGSTGGLIKVGLGKLTLSGISTYGGATSITLGTLALSGTGSIASNTSIDVGWNTYLDVSGRTDGTLTIPNTQLVRGSGSITGNVLNAGVLSPGFAVEKMNIQGKFTQATGVLNIAIGGATGPGVDYSQLQVSSTASVGGTLNVGLTKDYAPKAGDTFVVLQAASLSGTFGSVNLPSLNPGLSWNVGYSNNSVVLSVLSGVSAYLSQISNPAQRGYNSDPDGDGCPNLVEYATGGSPVQADTNGQVKATPRGGGGFDVVFSRNTAATDVTLVVEASSDLSSNANWSPIAVNSGGSWGGATNVTETGSGNLVTVTVHDSATGTSKRFFRLRVVAP